MWNGWQLDFYLLRTGMLVLLFFLGGCSAQDRTSDKFEASLVQDSSQNTSAQDTSSSKAQTSSSHSFVQKATPHFMRGDYGNAIQFYRKAVESDPKNLNAWLGLAGSYDHLRQFKLANKAYQVAVKLAGYTPDVLNNLGYHYLLRGDTYRARKMLTAALQKDPNNQFIKNNVKELYRREKIAADPKTHHMRETHQDPKKQVAF